MSALAPSTNSSGKAWPIGIVVGLSLVAVANAIMISIAVSNPSAPAATDHWRESMAWNAELAQREASAALGWSIAGLERSPDGGGLALTLIDREGHAIPNLSGSLTLERADSAAHDLDFPLEALASGAYLARGELPATGLYRLTLTAAAATGERFVTHQQLDLATLPPLAAPGGPTR